MMSRIRNTSTLLAPETCMLSATTDRASSAGVMIVRSSLLKNVSKDNQADLFAKFLKDHCEKDFTIMKPVKGRRFRHKYIVDPIKLEPWIYTKYLQPKTEKLVHVHMRVVDDTLRDFKFWYFDELSYGAVIVRDSEDLFILDQMDLLKFGRIDMIVLFQNPIKVARG
ncbi:hypothetical protein R6Q57_016441 [Mikania cordata]